MTPSKHWLIVLNEGPISFIGEQLILPIAVKDHFEEINLVFHHDEASITIAPELNVHQGAIISRDQIPFGSTPMAINGMINNGNQPVVNINLVFPDQKLLIIQMDLILTHFSDYELTLQEYYEHIDHIIGLMYGKLFPENLIPFLQTHFPEKGNWSAIETD